MKQKSFVTVMVMLLTATLFLLSSKQSIVLGQNDNTEEGVELRDPETVISDQYNDRFLIKLIRNGEKLHELEKIPVQQRSEQQRNQIISLRKEQQQLYQSFYQFLASKDIQDLITQRQRNIDENATVTFNLAQDIKLRESLERMDKQGVRAGILYPLLLEDRLELVLVSAYTPPIRKTVPLNRQDFNKTILLARNTINSRSNNYQPLQQLYQWLIEPLEPFLEEAKIDNIIYAPHRQLRYIPLAALHDGENWLINKYRFNNITGLSLTNFATPPNRNLKILAGAFSQGEHTITIGERQFTFQGLPYTETEVETISQTISTTDVRYNQDFNEDITSEMNGYGIVHFATHCKFVSGTPRDSFIVFGTGEHATLKDMETWDLSNVELVVLSGCEAGISDDLTPQVNELGNGVEVLGLGYQMQRRGAQATLASLWTVNDQSTQVLMNEFYRNLQQGNTTKAEALQLAQQSLIEDSNYDHPYNWAPFILIGNGL